MDEVKKYLKEKYHKPGNVFLGLLHRLDQPVFGIMLFAKTSKGASRLSEQFRQHAIEKTYYALVRGKPKKEKGLLVNLLGKDKKLGKAKEYEDGREVKLHYELITSNHAHSLLKITIEGGKFHQIRAQLSLAGLPIVGDVKYGGLPWHDQKAIALCAAGISFQKATEARMVNLQIDIPETWQEYVT